MTRSRPGNPKARTLGAELRKAREEAGIGVRELARILGCAHAWVTRSEAGTRVVTTEDVTAIAVALGVPGAERERLVELAREDGGPDWLRTGIPGVHQDLATLIQYERTASAIVEVAPLVIPGLLQTPDYTRAVLVDCSPSELETRAAMRAARRDILGKRKAPTFEALILESVLTAPLIAAEAMVDQYRHLQKIADLDNVTIRVIPTQPPRWMPAHSGQFMLFEFPKAPPLVHLEHLGFAAFLTSPGVVATYVDAVSTLRDASMSPEDSMEFIAACIARVEENAQ
ncbi:Transcriptional regulator, contains XRE-family HTH domain [Saccharopolyspora kobensis]|uniref:Transcriptional regulator, contains XRE-family HTH domain n=1 Tax=Saccharopolyspora kobensis TaxID=146035 RepID=A0A1H6ENB9_9PSEU|nr:helix-turn-helix transcriptional regulator [Saccharopolyspora kobensis]SEG98425.1 Transcriptional regulator, contains XRE-family HTH domain [Saccharopolyspora kobensis]SFF27057.1 Transcriptional regulator, contains XRE-family HTH domain [Saccharopolyspora kobensis]